LLSCAAAARRTSRDDKTAAHKERALALFRGGGGDTFMAERSRVHVTRLQTTYNALMFNHEKLKLRKVAGKKYGQCILCGMPSANNHRLPAFV